MFDLGFSCFIVAFFMLCNISVSLRFWQLQNCPKWRFCQKFPQMLLVIRTNCSLNFDVKMGFWSNKLLFWTNSFNILHQIYQNLCNLSLMKLENFHKRFSNFSIFAPQEETMVTIINSSQMISVEFYRVVASVLLHLRQYMHNVIPFQISLFVTKIFSNSST